MQSKFKGPLLPEMDCVVSSFNYSRSSNLIIIIDTDGGGIVYDFVVAK